MATEDLDPAAVLRRIAYLLERSAADGFRVRAFRTAADTAERVGMDRLRRSVELGTPTDLPGIGKRTAEVIREVLAGRTPGYLARLEAEAAQPLATGGEAVRAALRGDLHVHSDWSDGVTPIPEMVTAAADLGHCYLAVTDHSPYLSTAHGLTTDRLREQLDVIAELDARTESIRVLSGIEVDILEDGRLDQDPELLDRLDVVVASVHAKLRIPAGQMTRRMITALAEPHVDVLGHVTGRRIAGEYSSRKESAFDADLVFAACEHFGVAVEINCRPDRLDPPLRLLRRAVEIGCLFALDTDAHAPGELTWLAYGCARAEEAGVPVDRIVNTWEVEDVLAWTRRRG